MMKFCAGTMPVANACLRLGEHQSLVGGKKDKGCLKETSPGLVEILATQEPSSESDLNAVKRLTTLHGYPYGRWIGSRYEWKRIFGAR